MSFFDVRESFQDVKTPKTSTSASTDRRWPPKVKDGQHIYAILFLFAPFPDRCLLVPFYHIFTSGVKVTCNIVNLLDATLSPLVYYENLISHPRGLRFGTFNVLYITLYYFFF